MGAMASRALSAANKMTSVRTQSCGPWLENSGAIWLFHLGHPPWDDLKIFA
jgi:hypothetical protein